MSEPRTSAARKKASIQASKSNVVQQAKLMDSAGTAWHAVKYGNLEMITRLFPSQCNVYAKGPVGENVFHIAMLLNTPSTLAIAKYLVKLYGKTLVNTPYQERRSENDPPGNYEGETALHIAIVNHDFDMVKFLVQNGADVRARAYGSFFAPGTPVYYGEFPLSFAACTGQKDIVSYLKRHGARVNLDCDRWGNTALHMCVYHEQPDMYDHLVEYCGASEHVRNHRSQTPLLLAASLGMVDMFQHIYNKRRRIAWAYGPVTSYSLSLREIDSVQNAGEFTPSAVETIVRKGHLELLTDPLVQTLLSTKWQRFAAVWIGVQGGLYLALVVLQTFLAWLHSDKELYNSRARLALEIICLVMAVLFLLVETFDFLHWTLMVYRRRSLMRSASKYKPPLYPIPGEKTELLEKKTTGVTGFLSRIIGGGPRAVAEGAEHAHSHGLKRQRRQQLQQQQIITLPHPELLQLQPQGGEEQRYPVGEGLPTPASMVAQQRAQQVALSISDDAASVVRLHHQEAQRLLRQEQQRVSSGCGCGTSSTSGSGPGAGIMAAAHGSQQPSPAAAMLALACAAADLSNGNDDTLSCAQMDRDADAGGGGADVANEWFTPLTSDLNTCGAGPLAEGRQGPQGDDTSGSVAVGDTGTTTSQSQSPAQTTSGGAAGSSARGVPPPATALAAAGGSRPNSAASQAPAPSVFAALAGSRSSDSHTQLEQLRALQRQQEDAPASSLVNGGLNGNGIGGGAFSDIVSVGLPVPVPQASAGGGLGQAGRGDPAAPHYYTSSSHRQATTSMLSAPVDNAQQATAGGPGGATLAATHGRTTLQRVSSVGSGGEIGSNGGEIRNRMRGGGGGELATGGVRGPELLRKQPSASHDASLHSGGADGADAEAEDDKPAGTAAGLGLYANTILHAYKGYIRRMLHDPTMFIVLFHIFATFTHFVIWAASYGGIDGAGPARMRVREFDDVVMSLMGLSGWLALLYFMRGVQPLGQLVVVFERGLVVLALWVVVYAVCNFGFVLAFYACARGTNYAVALPGAPAQQPGIGGFMPNEPFKDIGYGMIQLVRFLYGEANYDTYSNNVHEVKAAFSTMYFLLYVFVVVLLGLCVLFSSVFHVYTTGIATAEKVWRLRWASYVLRCEVRMPLFLQQRFRLGEVSYDPVLQTRVYNHVFEITEEREKEEEREAQIKTLETLLERLRKNPTAAAGAKK